MQRSPDKCNTPIYHYLRKYAAEGMNVFHTPGHKLSRSQFSRENILLKKSLIIPEELTRDVLALDVTEIEGTDNLHCAEGIIKEAQELAAKALGADRTFFLVNGSTCGIQAAILSVCTRRQKIIVGRDSHKAVVSGMMLAGAEPVFVYPEYNEEFGIAEAIRPESIENALKEHPDAMAVLITRPNYYGICADIEEISRIVHAHHKILIVDEAHGAHLAFSPLLPCSALESGADICIQSAHKTLPAVTQGSYLHIKGNRVDIGRLEFNLSMLQTSSPSYILLAYLDIARELMEKEGERNLGRLVDHIETLKQKLAPIHEYKVLSKSNLGKNITHDATRLVINVGNLGISGYDAEKILREELKTAAEMADRENLLFVTTVADEEESIAALADAMVSLAGMTAGNAVNRQIAQTVKKMSLSIRDINPRAGIAAWQAWEAEKQRIPLAESQGRICATMVTPYPPGIPLVYPGEIIDKDSIEFISGILELGGKVNGIGEDGYISVTVKGAG